ncbi:hypothetical protein A2311_03625 [candidate division WOR-1 bacterium RIFOXYB2_FULL_48_7]|uniref:Yip1 domain-containing protein n=1 Tax=candidate division WOR-1 bacterium RIFOXYB2_FULL_48_7 TaxID=1802583 RepID=A0A1F4TUB2_UNCSA|nr:MAG: hypothetical protein A2311_03625 [candidate division WOR-1 bacterium RIFOXYB2_FULL_48_7]
MSALVLKVKAILLNPKEAITLETTGSIQNWFLNFVAPLALIPTIASLLNYLFMLLFFPATHYYLPKLEDVLYGSVMNYIMGIMIVFLLAGAIWQLAQYYSAVCDFKQAFLIVMYSLVPLWVGGALQLFPFLVPLQLIALAYSFYLIYIFETEKLGIAKENLLAFLLTYGLAYFVINLLVRGIFFNPILTRMIV